MNVPPTQPYLELASEKIGIPAPHHQAPADLHLGKVILQISNLERSLRFYQKIIGFQLLERDDTPKQRHATLGSLEGKVLLELREKVGVQAVPRRGLLGLYHFAVLLPSRGDLGRFLAHAQAMGAEVGQSDHLFSEATYLTDPDGISLEVYRDLPRAEWKVTAQGEVVGGLEPLNTAALRLAAGAEPWLGLPAGTHMGHQHFYVGDLKQGEQFYHAGLGLAKMTWSFPSALFLGAGGYHHHVGINVWAAGSRIAGENDAKLLEWELVLPTPEHVSETAQNLERLGYKVVPSSEAGIQGFRASDPWGITVHVFASVLG
jgi:catechol 2,3-dioxygenase